jgi:hypothetical protein
VRAKLSNISARAFFLCGVIVSLSGIVCYALGISPAIKNGRLEFGYANATALIIAVCLFITIANFKRKAIYISGTAIMSLALLLTFSLGGIAIFAIGALYYFSRKHPKLLLAALIITALSVALIIVNCQLSIINCYHLSRPVSTVLDRCMQYYDAIRVSVTHPLGIGPGRWKTEVFRLQSAYYGATRIHSAPLAVAAECGLPTALCLLALVVLFIRGTPQSMWKTAALMILAHSCIDITLTFPVVIAALVLCIANCKGRKPGAATATLVAAVIVLLALSYFTAPLYDGVTYDEPYLQSRAAFSDGDYGAATRYALDALERAPNVPIVYNWARDCAILQPSAKRGSYTEHVEALHAANGNNPFAEAAAEAKARYQASRRER